MPLENGARRQRVTRQGCGHVFHQECIAEWFVRCSQRCPTCNATFDLSACDAVVNRYNNGFTHFEGDSGNARKVWTVGSNDRVTHFEGAPGNERMVRTVFPNGRVEHFEGGPGQERKVWAELPGDPDDPGRPRVTRHFTGEKGAERLVRSNHPAEEYSQYYEGAKGVERRVRSEHPTEYYTLYYEGVKGAEGLVRCDQRDATGGFMRTEYYDGAHEDPRLTRVAFPDGRVEFPDGRVEHYERREGEDGDGHLAWIQHADGTTEYPAGAI